MNTRERERLRKEIVSLFKKISHPHIVDAVRMGRKMCAYCGFDTIDDIVAGRRLMECLVSIDSLLAEKSASSHRIVMRLSFLCTIALARRLDAARVAWGKVQDAVSTSLSHEQCRHWLNRLAEDPAITRAEIKAAYSMRDEGSVRLPRNMGQGCEKARLYSLRLRGYQAGLRARMSECRARREFTPATSASVSAARLASLELQEELALFIRECDNIERMLADQPVTEVRSRDEDAPQRRLRHS